MMGILTSAKASRQKWKLFLIKILKAKENFVFATVRKRLNYKIGGKNQKFHRKR